MPRMARPALFFSLVALAAVPALMAMGVGTSNAQESITVQGEVINGTGGAGPFEAGLPVLLLLSAEGGGLAATGQTTTDAAGRFRFDPVDLLEKGTYSLGVEYAGVLYRTSLTAQDAAKELQLTVYETTEDVSVVAVTRQVMVLSDVDKDSRQVAATELVRLVNRSDRTLLPAPLESGRMSFLRFSLPSQASELIVQSDLPPGDIISVGTGFALTSPVFPGDHAVEFSYLFPYNGDRVSYRQNLLQGAEIYQVLVPERLPGIQVTGLEPIALVNIQGSVFRAWEGRNFPRGEGPAIELVHLAQPGLLTRVENSFTNSTLWRNVIPIAAAAALAFLLFLGAFRTPRGSSTQVAPASSDAIRDPIRDPIRDGGSALVQAIAALDEKYQRGEVAEDRYQRARQSLKSRGLESSQALLWEVDDPLATGNQDGC